DLHGAQAGALNRGGARGDRRQPRAGAGGAADGGVRARGGGGLRAARLPGPRASFAFGSLPWGKPCFPNSAPFFRCGGGTGRFPRSPSTRSWANQGWPMSETRRRSERFVAREARELRKEVL